MEGGGAGASGGAGGTIAVGPGDALYVGAEEGGLYVALGGL